MLGKSLVSDLAVSMQRMAKSHSLAGLAGLMRLAFSEIMSGCGTKPFCTIYKTSPKETSSCLAAFCATSGGIHAGFPG